MTQNTFLFSNSIQKWMSVREYKSRAHCITWSVMISAQHCLQPPTECWREEVPYWPPSSTQSNLRDAMSGEPFVLALLKASGSLLRKRKNIFSYGLWWCCCLRDSSQGANMGNKHEHYLCTIKVLVPLTCEGVVSGAVDTHEQRLFCRSQM